MSKNSAFFFIIKIWIMICSGLSVDNVRHWMKREKSELSCRGASLWNLLICLNILIVCNWYSTCTLSMRFCTHKLKDFINIIIVEKNHLHQVKGRRRFYPFEFCVRGNYMARKQQSTSGVSYLGPFLLFIYCVTCFNF